MNSITPELTKSATEIAKIKNPEAQIVSRLLLNLSEKSQAELFELDGLLNDKKRNSSDGDVWLCMI
jgi:hypothetical protein